MWAQRELLHAGWTVQVDVLGGTLYVDSDIDGVLRGNLILRGSGDPKLVVERLQALGAQIRREA